MKLTNRVKSLRSSNGWTQEQFAQMIGVTRQTIISLEKGSYTPSLLLAMQIARVFERTGRIDFLFGGGIGMKRVIIQSCLNICMYFLAAVFISSIHDQLNVFQNDPVKGTGFNLTLDLSIILPVILVAIGLSVTGYWMRTDKKSSFSKWSSSTD